MVIPRELEAVRGREGANGGGIVVAYDGGLSSEAALDWAVRYAALSAEPLMLVYVDDGVSVLPEHPLTEDLIGPAAVQLENRAHRIRKLYPELELTTAVAKGEVLKELAKRSSPSTLLVVGAGEHRILHHPARWSLCMRLVGLVTGPIVVVPVSAERPGQVVVVGADGTEESQELVDYAAHLATGLKADLLIVHAWMPPVMVLNPYPLDAATMALVEEPHRRFTSNLTTAVQKGYPEIRVSGTTVRSHPAAALITADSPPELVVVGRRHGSVLQRAVLGSTSRDVILNLVAPTIVVPFGHPGSPVTSTG